MGEEGRRGAHEELVQVGQLDDRLGVVAQELDGKTTLIGVGGISSGSHAAKKRQLGADLVQLYTGLIYHGPSLVRDCIRKSS